MMLQNGTPYVLNWALFGFTFTVFWGTFVFDGDGDGGGQSNPSPWESFLLTTGPINQMLTFTLFKN